MRRGPAGPGAPEFIDKWVKWGAGLRASQALVRGGKARALMHGRYHVSIKDIQALAKPILRHRIMTNFYAESERINSGRDRRAAARRRAGAEERDVSRCRRSARERQFLDPAVVARLGTLELKARTVVEGFLSGLIAAPSKASASSSPSTASTFPATISRRSTGRSTRAAIAITSRSSRRRRTSTAT